MVIQRCPLEGIQFESNSASADTGPAGLPFVVGYRRFALFLAILIELAKVVVGRLIVILDHPVRDHESLEIGFQILAV